VKNSGDSLQLQGVRNCRPGCLLSEKRSSVMQQQLPYFALRAPFLCAKQRMQLQCSLLLPRCVKRETVMDKMILHEPHSCIIVCVAQLPGKPSDMDGDLRLTEHASIEDDERDNDIDDDVVDSGRTYGDTCCTPGTPEMVVMFPELIGADLKQKLNLPAANGGGQRGLKQPDQFTEAILFEQRWKQKAKCSQAGCGKICGAEAEECPVPFVQQG
jgi:hypothetical protein